MQIAESARKAIVFLVRLSKPATVESADMISAEKRDIAGLRLFGMFSRVRSALNNYILMYAYLRWSVV